MRRVRSAICLNFSLNGKRSIIGICSIQGLIVSFTHIYIWEPRRMRSKRQPSRRERQAFTDPRPLSDVSWKRLTLVNILPTMTVQIEMGYVLQTWVLFRRRKHLRKISFIVDDVHWRPSSNEGDQRYYLPQRISAYRVYRWAGDAGLASTDNSTSECNDVLIYSSIQEHSRAGHIANSLRESGARSMGPSALPDIDVSTT